jgi:hypothetical protein
MIRTMEEAGAEPVLAVDLDGTLIDTDLTAESFLALAGARPLRALATLAALRRGRAAFKTAIAHQTPLEFGRLPWNRPFIDWLAAECGRGRRLYLASASARIYVEAAARHLGLFDGVFASDPGLNLKSRRKAAALVRAFGERGFDYAGNETADLAVWEHAARVVAVNVAPGLLRRLRWRWPDAIVFPRAGGVGGGFLGITLPAWARTLLVFAPVLAIGEVAPAPLAEVALAYLSLGSLAAAQRLFAGMLASAGRGGGDVGIAPPRGFRLIARCCVAAAAPILLLPTTFAIIALVYAGAGLLRALTLRRRSAVDLLAGLVFDFLAVAAGVVASGG